MKPGKDVKYETFRFYSIDGFAKRFVGIDDFDRIISERNVYKKACQDALEVWREMGREGEPVAMQMAAILQDSDVSEDTNGHR